MRAMSFQGGVACNVSNCFHEAVRAAESGRSAFFPEVDAPVPENAIENASVRSRPRAVIEDVSAYGDHRLLARPTYPKIKLHQRGVDHSVRYRLVAPSQGPGC